MKITTEILFVLSAVGALNGLVLAVYLFFTRKKKPVAQLFLMLLVLTLSVRVTKSVFLYFNPGLLKIYLQLGLSACFFIGPSLYFYARSTFEQTRNVPRSWQIIYAVLLAITLVGGIAVPYRDYPETWGMIIRYLIYPQWTVFVLLTLYESWKNRSALTGQPLVKVVVIGNTLILAAYILASLNWIAGSYILGAIVYSFIFYLSLLLALYKEKPEERGSTEKYQNKKIAGEQAELLIARLEQAVRTDGLYRDADLSLNALARKMNIPPHQLSQLLNDNLGKSFSVFINEYKVTEAAERIVKEPHLKIEEIGYEVGFNSKSAFFSAFKKVKNTTPSKYRESLSPKSSEL